MSSNMGALPPLQSRSDGANMGPMIRECEESSTFVVVSRDADTFLNHAPTCRPGYEAEDGSIANTSTSTGDGTRAAGRCANLEPSAEFFLCWDHASIREAQRKGGDENWARRRKEGLPRTKEQLMELDRTGGAAHVLPPMRRECLEAWEGGRWRAVAVRTVFTAIAPIEIG